MHPSNADLPQPSAEALAHSARLGDHIRAQIAAAGGWLAFSRYMELALHAPGLGYYSAGARKLGRDGDFITAPEMTPLFGHALARQVADLFALTPPALLEVGAGSGALAASLLEALEKLGALPEQYMMLELSADLRERSRDTLAARVPHLAGRVAWLDRLPPSFSGVMIGNEVLDAMPADVFRVGTHGIEEGGVMAEGDRLAWSFRPAPAALTATVKPLALAPGYQSEVSLAAAGFVRSLASMLEQGVAIFIDYGFPRREYYHPQRSEGTLMCHYRHRAHADPFFLPGLQDITAHVDFTAVAESAAAGGLQVLGYATQAQFLINCGITDLLAQQLPQGDARSSPGQRGYLAASNAAQRLLSPAEMGELFKVIALGRGVAMPLPGFLQGDKTGNL
ncbi:MAG: class I SAM-dependent methyltransferase [Betaproteobacteria bacterium]|nr:class I SAM-dependent methyltransferase [Betaproteobacteria bacterium]